MASNLLAIASNLEAFVTSSFLLLVVMASNLLAMVSNLEALVTSSFLLLNSSNDLMASNLLGMASNLETFVTSSFLLLVAMAFKQLAMASQPRSLCN